MDDSQRLREAEALMRRFVLTRKSVTQHEDWCEVELGRQPDGTHGPCDCGYQLVEDMRMWLHAGDKSDDPAAGN
jgi:hypothetical protein